MKRNGDFHTCSFRIVLSLPDTTMPPLHGLRVGQGGWSASLWHSLFCILVLSGLLAAAGCGTPLGSDAEVSERNARIASEVKVALVRDSGLNAAPIDVQVNDGVVTLGGFVEHEGQRKSAEQAARQIHGVTSVVNNIKVK